MSPSFNGRCFIAACNGLRYTRRAASLLVACQIPEINGLLASYSKPVSYEATLIMTLTLGLTPLFTRSRHFLIEVYIVLGVG